MRSPFRPDLPPDAAGGKHMRVRSFQTMVPMRDGARLNTFVFLPESGFLVVVPPSG